jgi:hypothetical protein
VQLTKESTAKSGCATGKRPNNKRDPPARLDQALSF